MKALVAVVSASFCHSNLWSTSLRVLSALSKHTTRTSAASARSEVTTASVTRVDRIVEHCVVQLSKLSLIAFFHFVYSNYQTCKSLSSSVHLTVKSLNLWSNTVDTSVQVCKASSKCNFFRTVTRPDVCNKSDYYYGGNNPQCCVSTPSFSVTMRKFLQCM